MTRLLTCDFSTSHGLLLAWQLVSKSWYFNTQNLLEAAGLKAWTLTASLLPYSISKLPRFKERRALPLNGRNVKELWPLLICSSLNRRNFCHQFRDSPICFLFHPLLCWSGPCRLCLVLHRHNLLASHYEPLTSCPGHVCHYAVEGPLSMNSYLTWMCSKVNILQHNSCHWRVGVNRWMFLLLLFLSRWFWDTHRSFMWD